MPAYTKYQDSAKKGVVDSVLLNAARVIDTQRALNEATTTADFENIKSKGIDLGATAFNIFPLLNIPTTGAWCISFVKTSPVIIGTGKLGCVDSAGALHHGTGTSLVTATAVTCKPTGTCV